MMMMMMIDRPLSIITSYTLGPGYRPVVCRRNYFNYFSNGSIRRIFFVDGAIFYSFVCFFFVCRLSAACRPARPAARLEAEYIMKSSHAKKRRDCSRPARRPLQCKNGARLKNVIDGANK